MRVSPSQVESFTRCGLRWLLEVAAGAGSVDVVRQFGIVIHAAAVLAAEGAADDLIGDRIDEVWHHLDFGSAWYSEKQRELAHQMVSKFLAWHRQNPRDLVAYEESVRAQVGAVEITGRVDRLERDADGRAIVVDLKTSSAPVPAADKQARKGQAAEKAPADPAAEARARWARRLGRWAKKAEAQGVDAKALMTEALAG